MCKLLKEVRVVFWDRFKGLCDETKKSPSSVCSALGFSNATATHWKNGKIPNADALAKVADFFSVSADYLLGRSDTPRALPQDVPEPLRAAFLQLNEEGKEKLLEYADDLVQSGKYEEDDPHQH